MTLNATNIPSAKQAKVEVDFTDNTFAAATVLEDQITSVAPSGGETKTTDFAAINGDNYTQAGGDNPNDVVVSSIFTDGESNDLHPQLEAAKGGLVHLRWAPKGATTGNRRFVVSGILYRVDYPSLQESGAVLYAFAVRGNVYGEDIPV